jgi:phosphate transport system substrate-binding protein
VRRTLALLATAAVAASMVAIAAPANAAETISGGGASFPYPFVDACRANFNAAASNVNSGFNIQYQSTGSGTGKKNFTAGTFVYGQTDSAYAAGTDTQKFTWTYVPNIGGAIAFPINLRSTTTQKTLGSSIQLRQVTLAKIMGGIITMWNDKEILADNPIIAKQIPATAITVVYRSGTSGTSNNTLQYLNAWAPTIWAKVQDDFSTAFPGGKAPASSLTGANSAAIIATVNATSGAIGYVDYSDAKGYPVARIQNAMGEFVAPSLASATKTLAQQTNVQSNGLVTLNYNVKLKGAYPVVIFSYGLGRTDGSGPNGLGVRQFESYLVAGCGEVAKSLGYVPVSGAVLQKAIALAATIK